MSAERLELDELVEYWTLLDGVPRSLTAPQIRQRDRSVPDLQRKAGGWASLRTEAAGLLDLDQQPDLVSCTVNSFKKSCD